MATRALVLGAGGIVGVAWEIGVLAGLAANGIDLDGDVPIVGTSAGAVVGALVAGGRSLPELYERQRQPVTHGQASAPTRADPRVLARIAAIALLSPGMPREARARIGRLALAARTQSEEERLQTLTARLQTADWPVRPLFITAVAAEDGEFVVWRRDSGVPLTAAVAASSAVPGMYPPVTIAGRRYIDGGVRSTTNADLARGYEHVLILAPIGISARGLGGFAGITLRRELALLRREGSEPTVIAPDPAALLSFGPRLMDPARRRPAAEAGYRQGAALAAHVRRSWA